MATISVINILNKIYGPRGLPFPQKPKMGDQPVIAGGFEVSARNPKDEANRTSPIRKYDKEDLGSYDFLPATINGIDMPNALVIISGEKEIVETDIVDVGTVFEKVFTKPYDISIICTLIGEEGNWPEKKLSEMAALWKKDDLVTLKCALTDIFLQAENNLVISSISVLDSQGSENVEVIQIDGRSNIDFELEII